MSSENRFLLTGSEGWICGHLGDLLNAQGKTVHATNYRMENSAQMNEIFDQFQPTHVINCAGKTGRPNVDWCEDNRVETVRSNVIGTLMLAELCHERGVHLTNMATGCMCHICTRTFLSIQVGLIDTSRHLHLPIQRLPRHPHRQTLHRR